MKQIKLIEKANIENNSTALKKAINKFTDGKLYKDAN